jgi:hypothetical protein
MAGDRHDVQGQQPGQERQVTVTSLRGEKLDRLRAFRCSNRMDAVR